MKARRSNKTIEYVRPVTPSVRPEALDPVLPDVKPVKQSEIPWPTKKVDPHIKYIGGVPFRV